MANKQKRRKQLLDGYRFDGFTPVQVKGVFGDPKALVIELTRRSKKRAAAFVAKSTRVGTTRNASRCVIYRAVIGACIWRLMFAGFTARVATR